MHFFIILHKRKMAICMKKYGEKSLFNVLNVLGIGCTLGVVASCSNNINEKNSYDNVRGKEKGRGRNPQRDSNGKKENPQGQPRSANNSNGSKEKITPQVQSKNNPTIPKTAIVSKTQQLTLEQLEQISSKPAREILENHSFEDLLDRNRNNKNGLCSELVAQYESEPNKKKFFGSIENVKESEKDFLTTIGFGTIEKTYDFFQESEKKREEKILKEIMVFWDFNSLVSIIDEFFSFDLNELNFFSNNNIIYSIFFSLDAEDLKQLIELLQCYHVKISTCIDKLKVKPIIVSPSLNKDLVPNIVRYDVYSSIGKFNSDFCKYRSDLTLQECSSKCISSLQDALKNLRTGKKFKFNINFRGVDFMHIMFSYCNSSRKKISEELLRVKDELLSVKNENQILRNSFESTKKANIAADKKNTLKVNKINDLNGRIMTIEKAKNELGKKIKGLEGKCSQLTNENINLKNKITQKKSKYITLQKNYEQLDKDKESKYITLQQVYKQLEEDIDKQKESFQKQAKEVNKVYLEVLNPIIDETEKKEIEIQKLNDQMQKLKEDSEIKIRNLQQEVRSVKNDYSSLEERHAKTDNIIFISLDNEIKSLRGENGELREKNRECQGIIEKYKEENEKMKKKLDNIWSAFQSDKEQGEK